MRLSSIDRTAMSWLRTHTSVTSTPARAFRSSFHTESAVCDCESVAAVCLGQIHDVVVQRNHAEIQRAARTLHIFDLHRYSFVLDLSKHSALSVRVVANLMSEPRNITVNMTRKGQEPHDDSWKDLSPAERIEMVWTLTKLCMTWNNQWSDEPRLQRTVTRLQRRER